jgi:hypothetical protein
MKGYNLWSYAPYKPLVSDGYDIYICRIVPSESAIHFEWLENGACEYSVYYRKRGEGEFILAGKTEDTFYDINGLVNEAEYEFYVSFGAKKSRVRLARCGAVHGSVVTYLHPEDEAYIFSGKYLCSPSLVRHPDGYLLASMDVHACLYPQNLTLIYRSDDEGESWHYVSELFPSFWGKMFVHRGELYMLSCSTEYGDLLIGKSSDGAKTFTAPVTLLRGSNGKNGFTGIHKNPQNVLHFKGRIYETLEFGSWDDKVYGHAAMVMSCDENADLLNPESWSFSEPRKFEAFTPELLGMPTDTMTIEGTLTLAPDGKLLNVMRFGKHHTALAYEVDTENLDAPLKFSRLLNYPANFSKFMIKFDTDTGYYYSIGTRVYDENKPRVRNLLSLLRSKNLTDWEVVFDIFDYRNIDDEHVGFQYVDFEFSGDDIIFLCRTAFNGAHNFHDSNYQTFHKIKNFRNI